jgi:hypothetical protein
MDMFNTFCIFGRMLQILGENISKGFVKNIADSLR